MDSNHVGIGYRPALDGLRACAVLAVVAFHSDLIDGGWLGVDLFFALSGYLITSLLVAEVTASGTVALKAFWMRRIRRLLPAVGLLIALVVVLGSLNQIAVRSSGVWGALTYSTNWVQVLAEQGYWDTFAQRDPLSHLWSLAVEEQFYVAWPLLVWMVARRWGSNGVQHLAALAATLALGTQLLGLARGWSLDRMYVGTDTRALAFLLGAAATHPVVQHRVGQHRVGQHRVGRLVATLAGLGWLTAAVRLRGDTILIFRGPLQVLSLGAAVVIVAAASTVRAPFWSAPLYWPPLRAVGRWSYGIYLFHWPLAISRDFAELAPVVRFAVVAAASTGLAAMSYRYLELPIRQRRYPRAKVAGFALASAALVTTALVMAQPAAPTLATLPTLPARPTLDSVGVDAVRVSIIGDSVPALAAPAFAAVARARAIELEIDAEPGCVGSAYAIDELVPEICTPFVEGISARIQAVDPNVVVLWFGGTGQFFQDNGTRYDFCSNDGAAAFRQRLEFLIAKAQPERRTVLVVIPVPRADLDADAAAGAECEAGVIRGQQSVLNIGTIELAQMVCPSYPDDCQRVPRPDGLHFSPQGAATVASFVFDEVQSVL